MGEIKERQDATGAMLVAASETVREQTALGFGNKSAPKQGLRLKSLPVAPHPL